MARANPRMPWVSDVITQAESWREQCFFGDGSLFSSDSLWTLPNIKEILERTKTLKKGEGTYYEKLERDLHGASRAAIRFDAELHWFMLLFFLGTKVQDYDTNIKPETKRNRLTKILSWGGAELPDSAPALQDQALLGVGSNKESLKNNLYKHHRYMLHLLASWKRLPLMEISSYQPVGSSWDFALWCDVQFNSGDTNPEMRNALLYFLYPDRFEAIMSSGHKREIVRGLNKHLSPDAIREFLGSGDFSSATSIDRAIFDIRQNLEHDRLHKSFDFYVEFLDENANHRMEDVSQEAALIEMHKRVGKTVSPPNFQTPLSLEEIDEKDEKHQTEGEKRLVKHFRRERSPALRKGKIERTIKENGFMHCECCGTRAESYSPEKRHRIFEVHHKKPLADGITINGLDDLVLLCANCHRGIHASDPIKTVDQFREECAFPGG